MAELDRARLRSSMFKRLEKYKKLLKGDSSTPDELSKSFWDAVVVTAGSDSQKQMYQSLIESKQSRRELPSVCKYFVVSDPPDVKVGDGGAVLNVIHHLAEMEGVEYIEKSRILLINAGGYSQRFPSASVGGKIFLLYPIDGQAYHMLDLQLMAFIEFPERMIPGIYVSSSDVILPCDLTGEWSFTEPGFTGIAIVAEAQMGTTHGVYVLEDPEGISRKYKEDPANPTMMASFKRFIHKVSTEEMEKSGAILKESGKVYIDHSYFLDSTVAKTFLEFYQKEQPITCEIDGYGDFLRPLGPDSTTEYFSNKTNVVKWDGSATSVRKKLYHLLKDTPARALLLNQGAFVHFGTTTEYLEHLCHSSFVKEACLFTNEASVKYTGRSTAVQDKETTEPASKVAFQNIVPNSSVVMLSSLDRSAFISEGTVVEMATIEDNVTIGESCIISNVHLKSGLTVPNGSYIHTVAIELNKKKLFVTFAFGVEDDLKAKLPREKAGSLHYCGIDIDSASKKLCRSCPDSIWPKECEICSLWNAKLFSVCNTRQESACDAVDMLCILKNSTKQSNQSDSKKQRLSMEDLVALRSIDEILHNIDSVLEH